MPENFNAKRFDQWVNEQIEKQLSKIPQSITDPAKQDRDGAEIVRDNICRALCFSKIPVERYLRTHGFNF